MRIVLDTNVLVSGILWRGAPHQILQAWAEGKIELLCSIPILDEYRRVLEDLGKDLPDFDLGAWKGGRPLLLQFYPSVSLKPFFWANVSPRFTD